MMLTLKKLSRYIPEYMLFDAYYLQTEDGEDWYYHRRRFKSDTLKICLDDAGVVRMFGYNAELLWPEGLTVIEVAADNVPDALDCDGGWQYVNGKIVQRTYTTDEWSEWVKLKRQSLMSDATMMITTLNDAVDFGDATEEEKAQLQQWVKYRVLLMRIDPTKAPDIEWPASPDKQ